MVQIEEQTASELSWTPTTMSSIEWERARPPADVTNLEQLCADRELVTTEVFWENACYGIADIIKRWAGTPQERPLMIALPHGVEYGTAKFFTQHELVPVVATCRSKGTLPYSAMPISRLWHVASPYVHVTSMSAVHDHPVRRGSVFFPLHSTATVPIDQNVREVINNLRGLPECFHPVTVCIYWADVLRGVHRAYLDAGFKVTSAGHIYDPVFLYRLHRICIQHQFAVHHHVGSAVAFSIKSGCRTVTIQDKPIWTRDDLGRATLMSVRLLGELVRMSYAEQLAWADHLLGSRFLRTPAETAVMIRRAERLDRVGFFAERGLTGRRNPFTMPTICRRAVRHIVPPALVRRVRPVVRSLRTRGRS